MIEDAIGGRILELNVSTYRTIFVELKLNAKDSGASKTRQCRRTRGCYKARLGKSPRFPTSNVLDVIEFTVVVFASYAVKTCTAKAVIGPRAGIKRALE